MMLPKCENLRTVCLGALFKDIDRSYEFFWFRAVLETVLEGKTIATFDEVIHTMVADAWPLILRHRLSFGASDALEALVHHTAQACGLKTNASKDTIASCIKGDADRSTFFIKDRLIQDVPYRLQLPLFTHTWKEEIWQRPSAQLARSVNAEKGLIYYFLDIDKPRIKIEVRPDWADYIRENREALQRWLASELSVYLRAKNPGREKIEAMVLASFGLKAEKTKSEAQGDKAAQKGEEEWGTYDAKEKGEKSTQWLT